MYTQPVFIEGVMVSTIAYVGTGLEEKHWELYMYRAEPRS